MRIQRIPPQKKGPAGEKLCRWCEQPVPKGRRTFCGATCVHECLLRCDPGYLRAETKKRDHGICADCGLDTEAIKLRYLKVAKIAQQGILGYEALKKQAMKRTGITKERLWEAFNRRDRAEVIETHEKERRYQDERWKATKASFEAAGQPFNRQHPSEDKYIKMNHEHQLRDAIDMTAAEKGILVLNSRLRRLAKARKKRMLEELEASGFRGCDGRDKLINLWQADHIHPVAEGGGGCCLENIQTLCSRCHKGKTARQARRAALIRKGIDPDAPTPPDPQLDLPL